MTVDSGLKSKLHPQTHLDVVGFFHRLLARKHSYPKNITEKTLLISRHMIRLSKGSIDYPMLHTQVTKENMNSSVPIFVYSLLMSFWLRSEMIDA